MTPLEYFHARATAVSALEEWRTGNPNKDSLNEAQEKLENSSKELGPSEAGIAYHFYACLLKISANLIEWAQAVRTAEQDADRYLRAARVLLDDLFSASSQQDLPEMLWQAAKRVRDVSLVQEVDDLPDLLLGFALPLPIFPHPKTVKEREIAQFHAAFGHTPQEEETQRSSVAFVRFTINSGPLEMPHTLSPGVVYDLGIEVRVSNWPQDGGKLTIDVATVEPSNFYRLPSFSFDRPEGDPPYTLKSIGRLCLLVSQGFPTRPFEFVYCARFSVEPSWRHDVSVEGHRQLHLRSFDPALDPQSGYTEVDTKLFQIRDDLLKQSPPLSDEQRLAFLTMLCRLGAIAGMALSDHIFRGDWAEKRFQEKIQELLRAEPHIGSDLEVHPVSAGGITDLSYKRIRIELKSEPDRYVGISEALEHSQQEEQYIAGSDRRLGILCVLDVSPKDNSPGSVQNDISLEAITSREDDGIPLLIGVVIIRGNLARPSDL